MKVSLEKGENTELETIDKFVDGAAVKRVGDLSFEICKQVLMMILSWFRKEKCVRKFLNCITRMLLLLSLQVHWLLQRLTFTGIKLKGKMLFVL